MLRALCPALAAGIAAAAIFSCAGVADAALYSFTNLTNNDATNTAAAGQFQLTVAPDGSGVLFTIDNLGPAASSITHVYFDDESLDLLDSGSVVGTPGTNFSAGGSPPNLPGGDGAVPPFIGKFRFTADSPPTPNGANVGESAAFFFSLEADTTAAMIDEALRSGDLRLGIHVQAFANRGSESFVTVVPEPASLAVAGLAGLALLRRRR